MLMDRTLVSRLAVIAPWRHHRQLSAALSTAKPGSQRDALVAFSALFCFCLTNLSPKIQGRLLLIDQDNLPNSICREGHDQNPPGYSFLT